MNVSHHLTDETIQDYAAGSLSMAMETLVACHLTVCSHCRSRMLTSDSIGGSLLLEVDPVKVTGSATDVLKRASMAPEHAGGSMKPPATTVTPGIPRPLGRFLPEDGLNGLDWRRIAPGIKQFNLSNQHRKFGAFQLLHLEPGVRLSEHSHNDRELTYLVQGSYQDEIGHFQAGDIADLDSHEKAHRPVVNSDGPCIALIATQSPVNYSGVVGKIMQPFVGI